MDKHYNPAAIEKKWYIWWEENGYFADSTAAGGEPYVVVIPPPNVTGILHMGHALNSTIQDIIVRWRRMQGRNTIWIPGTDHAGIATQNVVERALRSEGSSREQLGRDAFTERVWQWREEYGGTIVRQLRRLGASCDWSRERFTMDAGLSAAVTEVFCRLYDEGLIYRGNYIVNWCPRCHTALSDEESEHQDTKGHLWHIRYPIEGGGHVVVATTRPETMLGDTAVAVNPADERYRELLKKRVILPLLNRPIAVVADDYVDPAFGTGVVKITPAHDPNDFLVAERHNLEAINVMNGNATMNEAAGPYAGLDRFACRKQLLADLEAQGLLEKIEDHQHAVGHCYRCDTVVEPRLSRQWFVRMKPLAEPAIAAVRSGEIEFVPSRWDKVYFDWMENIRDWCISRQIWWGHRIPVYTCSKCQHEWAARSTPTTCPKCNHATITQEEDVLDTWFSSWLWPFSTLGWPQANPDLKFYYPSHDLVTAPDIIFFWVARMIMAGLKFAGEIPFRRVHIHGIVRDGKGRKMSKSLGNSLDPLSVIDETSADALRFSMMMITAMGQDVKIDMKDFEIGRNFGTKLWNAARFMRLHLDKAGTAIDCHAIAHEQPQFDTALLTDDDRHLLARLAEVVTTTSNNLEKFRFQDCVRALYDFLWSDYCDWYLEYAKSGLADDSDAARRRQILHLMNYVFARSLLLLHPFMPFLTEELWHAMGYGYDDESIMRFPWPGPFSAEEQSAWGLSDEVTDFITAKHELISAGRALRADYNIAPTRRIRYIVAASDAATATRLQADAPAIATLLRASELIIETAPETRGMPGSLGKLGAIHLPLEGLIDFDAERARIAAEITQAQKLLAGVEAKLKNDNFVSRAPAAVVEQQRTRQEELQAEIKRLAKLAGLFAQQG